MFVVLVSYREIPYSLFTFGNSLRCVLVPDALQSIVYVFFTISVKCFSGCSPQPANCKISTYLILRVIRVHHRVGD